jgi:Na+/H+ antiporter NhaD/arsenite permease-like protein
MIILASAAAELGHELGVWMIAPFAALLLSIAILPLATPIWFEHLRNKAIIAALFGVPVVLYLAVGFGEHGRTQILHTAEEYVSFIVLLLALFTISGGIYLSGDVLGTPRNNLTFLGIGAVLANFVGTTGAAMLLVRPLLKANSERIYKQHIFVFMIFTVANIGGCLTPLGDPPLFLGFLRGVDFFWTLRLAPEWATALVIVLAIFFVLDRYYYKKEPASAKARDAANREPLRIHGKINFLFLAGVIASVLLSAPLLEIGESFHFPFLREVIMIGMVLLSLFVGPRIPRQMNRFSWAPIGEVAIIFAGIFAAMIPALAILEARGGELGVNQPWQFFWITGALSSFLDNAPTYLTFTSTAQGLLGLDNTAALMGTEVVTGIGHAPAAFLTAISLGAVFMGANSYIGNAPNFMVKSISEEQGVHMPHFFAYMLYAAVVLIPVFVLVTVIYLL